MPKEDKFLHFLQAMISETRAGDIVRSYPPTEEIYDKVVKSLENRFGREDHLIKCYSRELLDLVLPNAAIGNKKTSLSNLFDKLETYIHAPNLFTLALCGYALPTRGVFASRRSISSLETQWTKQNDRQRSKPKQG